MRVNAPDSSAGTQPRGLSDRRGFTLVELLTLLAMVAVLATLIASAAAGAKLRTQQTVCSDNLRQLITASDVYARETGKRPRSVTRLSQQGRWLSERRLLICPTDSAGRTPGATNAAWGNVANASQEPWEVERGPLADPESGSWQSELSESVETVAFSYLHTFGWRKQAWQRLTEAGKEAGLAVCQLHGVRVTPTALTAGAKPYLSWEGQTYRAQRDGAVVSRRIFRSSGVPGSGSEVTTTAVQPAPGTDYPWEFYVDSVPPQRKGNP